MANLFGLPCTICQRQRHMYTDLAFVYFHYGAKPGNWQFKIERDSSSVCIPFSLYLRATSSWREANRRHHSEKGTVLRLYVGKKNAHYVRTIETACSTFPFITLSMRSTARFLCSPVFIYRSRYSYTVYLSSLRHVGSYALSSEKQPLRNEILYTIFICNK